MTGAALVLRPARTSDADQLCAVLNDIIRAGGTTAMEVPLSRDDFCEWFITGDRVVMCHSVLVGQTPAGFQSLTRHDDLPAGWADISSFTRRSPLVRGLGWALFGATVAAARGLGLTAINATIRADNRPGLGYYRRMGFVPYDVSASVPLRDGRPVDRIHHRFDL